MSQSYKISLVFKKVFKSLKLSDKCFLSLDQSNVNVIIAIFMYYLNYVHRQGI